MHTIAFANQKGGTGKTTACVNVGAGLVRAGHRVLLLDLDSQGNATVSVGIRPAADQPTTAEFLQGQVRLEDVMVDSYLADLSVIPATPDLAHLEVVLAGRPKSQFHLRKAFERSETTLSAFDYILIDCPPSLSLLTVNGLSAAKHVIVPVLCDYLSLEGLSHLIETIGELRRHLNPSLEILGILPNLVDHRLRITEESLDLLRKQFGDRLFRTRIGTCSRLREAPSFGKAVFDYAPASTAAEQFAALVREIQRRVR